MKILVYSKYFNFKNMLEKPRIETFVVDLPQIPHIGETIVVERMSPKNQFVIIFEYIVIAVQLNADSLGDNSPSSRVQAFLNHCWEGTSNFNVANFLEKQPLL
ncbi:MAG: hypothetical protein DSM106950_26670 [Stigonema ocellatum SAG 48.90 = DSM 106950]|nr:hypothetical protein [Stigonema ocellatum SAG 48.90 = DSM 106950]